MSALSINPPYPVFPDIDGQPLEDGYIWIGTAGMNPISNPIVVYWDAALTIPAPQPIRTIGGFPARAGSPAMLYANSDYSIQVQNKNGSVVYSSLNATERYNEIIISSVNAVNVLYDPPFLNATQTNQQEFNARYVNVKDFGAIGDGVANDTLAILAAKAYCIINLPITLYFPKGVYIYTEIGNWAYRGLTIQGDGKFATKLKCINTSVQHTALLLNAFASGSPLDPFIDDCNLRHLTVEGNANTLRVIRAQGISRSHWVDVDVRSAIPAIGIGFLFEGCSINQFDNLSCVNYPANPMSSVPNTGLYLTNGFRASVDIGQSTNNVFINAQMEYIPMGTHLNLADNNTFIGGTDESCTIYGLYIANGTNRYNTFIGRAWENQGGTADVLDGGIYSKFINCYSLNSILIQERGCFISGGIHETINVQAGSEKAVIENLTVNYVGAGGFIDSGTATEWRNIYDEQLSAYIYPLAARVNITPTGSPFTWVNTTGQYVNVVVQSGTISAVTMTRGGVSFIAPDAVPNIYLLAPTDTITLTYSVAPLLSYLPQNGFQG